MAYYIATISVSLNANSDTDIIKQLQIELDKLRENKSLTPYVDQIKKISNNPDVKNRHQKLDQFIIKNLNTKK